MEVSPQRIRENSDNMIKDVNCPGERSRTQAELAALREARRDQVEEVDQLYSTRQVPFLTSLHRDDHLTLVLDSGSLDTQQLFFSMDLTRVFRSWRRRQGCNVNLRSFVDTKVQR